MVYDDAQKLYEEVAKSGKALLEDAFSVLFPGSVSITSPSFKNQAFKLGELVAVNTTFLPRREIVRVPTAGLRAARGEVVQTSRDGKDAYVVMECAGEGQGKEGNAYAMVKDVGGASLKNVPAPVSGE